MRLKLSLRMVETHLEPNSARHFPHSSGRKAKLLHAPQNHMGAGSVLPPKIRVASVEKATDGAACAVVSVRVLCMLSAFKKYSKVPNERQMPQHF